MRAFAQSIVETVRYPLVILDAGFAVLSANPAFYRMFGLTEADVRDRALPIVDALRDVPSLVAFCRGLQSSRTVEGVELECEIPHLGRRVLSISSRSVTHDDGSHVVLLSLEDATDQALAGRLLRELNTALDVRVRERTAQLRAANAELEAFCYSVSHDLRAPLRALDGFSDELLRSYTGRVLDERAEHYLRRIRLGSQRMAHLIDDLLRLSRLSRMEIKSEPVDLTAMAVDIVAELRQRSPERSVSVEIEPGLCVAGDAALLRIALENLIGNAWKFTSSKRSASIQVGRGDEDGTSVFYVKDDGDGFDMAHATRLFGAFQRLHDEREFPGNGIGLATVQRIVHRHGGRIWAAAKPASGATFSFTLAPAPSCSRSANTDAVQTEPLG